MPGKWKTKLTCVVVFNDAAPRLAVNAKASREFAHPTPHSHSGRSGRICAYNRAGG